MGTPLLERINGQSYNLLNYLHNRRTINIYVENEDDIPFWNYFFSKRKLSTNITTATVGDKRGKQSVLAFSDRLSKEFILCVDSDFDFLHNCKTEQSRLIITNPFIFHTYIHSIESYKCYADIIENVLVDATHTKNILNFDIPLFIKSYSNKVHEIFLIFMFYEQKYQLEFEEFTITKQQKELELSANDLELWISTNKPIHLFPLEKGLNSTIKIVPQILNNIQGEAELLKLDKIINDKKATIPIPDITTFLRLKDELHQLGLDKENSYLFIQGHTLFTNVVMRFLSPLYNRILSNKRSLLNNEISSAPDDKKRENIENNLRHFETLIAPIESALEKHKYFDNCPYSEKIMIDIDSFINNYLNNN